MKVRSAAVRPDIPDEPWRPPRFTPEKPRQLRALATCGLRHTGRGLPAPAWVMLPSQPDAQAREIAKPSLARRVTEAGYRNSTHAGASKILPSLPRTDFQAETRRPLFEYTPPKGPS